MASITILEQVSLLMRDFFEDYDGPITSETTANDIEQWDSLANVQLMVMIEQSLGVRFSTGEIVKLTKLGDLSDLIEQKKAQSDAD